MKLLLLGAPGAGKGTQAAYLTKALDIPQISTGDMLRAAAKAQTRIGLEAKAVMDRGELVSDDIIIDLVKERITHDDCRGGFLFDGFPRTLAQAEAMRNASVFLDAVIEIDVADEDIIKRISGRRVHEASGRSYHIDYSPPKVADTDDVTGEPLIQRVDDSEETVRTRLSIYHNKTAPLKEYYRSWSQSGDETAPKYVRVKGVGDVSQISEAIMSGIKADGPRV